MAVDVDFHRVIVCAPITYIPTGRLTGVTVIAPPDGSFDPTAIRVTRVQDIRPGDLALGTIQHHYGPRLEPLDHAQWVSYFSSVPKPQKGGARPWNPSHCDQCLHEGEIWGISRDAGWISVDGCTLYRPDALLLVIPRELCPAVNDDIF
ncbi:hypothetical protein [Streptomyces sp. 8L]|uniref:hypothetical protein n=1 Tax=Streptomyces sp. 8L TaxID=2877242 RepID=UPI001CD5DF46|nr:hypothetical protein [Streptomyces sp. 8L]MCA1224106.1 hypothetical protein [Streptomyces sp. 8L]